MRTFEITQNLVSVVYSSGTAHRSKPVIEFKITPYGEGSHKMEWRLCDPIYVNQNWRENPLSWSNEYSLAEIQKECEKILIAKITQLYNFD